ncbi:thioredoxin [Shimazuella sp. AN120528]|uniref:thioredoxin n=1 Tax=Shimazuella soli TaxID=1892854 RepID=UPI001F0DEE70|nr:thioredoxin [Shimazuella soli]MCH5584510.1 thioredoxin [Shimazuella soli]
MAIVEVTDKDFGTSVEGAESGTVLVDFWAPWCGPCKIIAPILEEVNEEIGEKVTIAKLNVDNNPESASRFGVMSIPTLMVFQNGEMKSKLVGLQPKEQLIQWLGEYM